MLHQLQLGADPTTIWISDKGAPTPASLTALLFYYEEGNATELLRQVRSTWKNVIYMDRDSKPRAIDREVP